MKKFKILAEEVERLVRSASEIMFSGNFEITEKSGVTDIVTTSDLNIQRFLCERLSRLMPEAGFICEEEHLSGGDGEYKWVIDPIDGTTNYSRGIAECAISVALVHNGTAVIGVVFNPYLGDMFTAVAGEGAKLNGKPIHVSDMPFAKSLLCTAASLYKKQFAPVCFEIIEEAYEICNDIRRIGTCALELCYIAAGKCDLYFEIRVFPWDYAGAMLVLTEAGGILKGLNGEQPNFDKPTALIGANTRDNYEKLNAIVQKHLKKLPY